MKHNHERIKEMDKERIPISVLVLDYDSKNSILNVSLSTSVYD